MLQKDVRVGAEYALATSRPGDPRFAARVTVLAAPAGGQVRVRVEDPGVTPAFREPSALGQELTVRTLQLLHPWSERARHVDVDEVARRGAQHAAVRGDEHERTRARPPGGHAVPDRYEVDEWWDPLDHESGRRELAEAFAAARSAHAAPASPETIDLLFRALPERARLDVISAIGGPGAVEREDAAPGAGVGEVFRRGARLLDEAARAPWLRRAPQAEQMLTGTDVDFVEAVLADLAAAGQTLVLPPVPPLRDFHVDDRLPASLRGPRALTALGWLRLSSPRSSGTKVHGMGCSSLRGEPDPPERTPTSAWWQLLPVSGWEVCGVCGGPNLHDLVELGHVLAASDAWEARGRGPLEAWQTDALVRLVGATVSTRARQGEPDISLDGQLWTSLAPSAPGPDGWAAYRLCTALNGPWAGDPEPGEEPRRLAVRRLNETIEALPLPLRPSMLPPDADAAMLRDCFTRLRAALDGRVTALSRLVFGLPGAI